MAATGLDVFDRTLQIINTWLDEVMETTGPDRHVAWHALTAVLHTLRDRLPVDLSAHLGAQLPLLIRGAYYDQWHPAGQPDRVRSAEEFLDRVGQEMANTRPVNLRETTEGVFRVIGNHVTAGQTGKVREALPGAVRALWPEAAMAERQTRP